MMTRMAAGLAQLIEAVNAGELDHVRAMLAQDPALVRARGDHDRTALHWAAEHDRAEIAAALLAAGAEVEPRTSWGATPLDWAAWLGSGAVVDVLLAAGASGFNLVAAAGVGRLDEVRRVLESGEDLGRHRRRGAPGAPDDDHWPAECAHLRGDVISDALTAAARNGHAEVVAYLAGRGADVNAKAVFGATGLQWAAIHGHRDTVDWLLAHGADPAIRDARFASDAAGWAEEGGHPEIAALLRRQSG
jgi:ankyrin repeat protein